MASTGCPTESDLIAFLVGDRCEFEVIAEHLGRCAACEAEAERLDRLTGTIAAALRRRGGAELGETGGSTGEGETTLDASSQGKPPGPARAEGLGFAGGGPPDYEILGLLGRGGMGEVYKARHHRLNRVVALKVIRGEEASRSSRLPIEAEAAARLKHANIVQIYEVGEDRGRSYLALEYVEGGSLERLLDGTPRPPREVAELLQTLALAVQHAHAQGIVHRDLKPANILLADGHDGSRRGPVPKVADFGIARLVGADDGPTREGDILGTPAYMAPEQAAGRLDQIGPATDVYSLGTILYELLTGHVPFRGLDAIDTLLLVRTQEPVPPRRLNPRVPRDLETICLKCLQKEPEHRYASAEMLAEDLRRFLATETIVARPTSIAERAWKWSRRRPAIAGLLAALAAAIAIGFAAVAVQWRRAEANLGQSRRNLALAERAVDDLLTRVGENRLVQQPGLQGLRVELLSSAVPYYEEFVRINRDDPTQRSALADAHLRLGRLHMILNQPRPATDQFRRVLAVTDGARGDLGLLLVRAKAFGGLAQVLGTTKPEEALAEARRGSDLIAALAARHPRAPGVEETRVALATNLASALSALGRRDEAERIYRSAIATREERTGLPDDAVRRNRRDLARLYLMLAFELSRTAGRAGDASAAYQKARGLYDSLVETEPQDIWHRFERAEVEVYYGEFLIAVRGQFAEALGLLRSALQGCKSLARENPLVSDFRFEEAMAHYEIGYALLRTARYEEAAEHDRAAIELLDRLVREFPDVPGYRSPGLAGIWQDLGEVHHLRGDLGAARNALERSLALKVEVAHDNPGVEAYQRNLAMVHRYLAFVEAEAGAAVRAEESARAGLAILDRLEDSGPMDHGIRSEQGWTRVALGDALRLLGREDEALTAYLEAADVLRPIVEAGPGPADYRVYLAVALARAAAAEAATGRSVESRADGKAAVSLLDATPLEAPDQLLRTALVRSLAASLADDPEAVSRLANSAIEALGRAVAVGLATPIRLRHDPAFALLRDRDDFQALLAQVESRAAKGEAN